MTLFRTVPPTVEPVTLAECKTNLRIDHDAEDGLIGGLIRAAREEVEQRTGTALIEQNWRMTLDRWPRNSTVALNLHPLREILSVTVYGSEGEAALLDPASYLVDRHARPARLHRAERPEPRRIINGIEIDLSAGFGETGVDVPDLLKRAILLLVGHWYEFRAAFGASEQPVSIPDGFDRLIAGYRSRRLC